MEGLRAKSPLHKGGYGKGVVLHGSQDEGRPAAEYVIMAAY